MKLNLIPVEPIGSYQTAAFVDGPGIHEVRGVEVAEYSTSENGKRLYELRMDKLLTLRATASILGIKPSELSGLERGKFTLTEAEWESVLKAVQG